MQLVVIQGNPLLGSRATVPCRPLLCLQEATFRWLCCHEAIFHACTWAVSARRVAPWVSPVASCCISQARQCRLPALCFAHGFAVQCGALVMAAWFSSAHAAGSVYQRGWGRVACDDSMLSRKAARYATLPLVCTGIVETLPFPASSAAGVPRKPLSAFWGRTVTWTGLPHSNGIAHPVLPTQPTHFHPVYACMHAAAAYDCLHVAAAC